MCGTAFFAATDAYLNKGGTAVTNSPSTAVASQNSVASSPHFYAVYHRLTVDSAIPGGGVAAMWKLLITEEGAVEGLAAIAQA